MPRFQFSLRTLLIAVALLAIPCAYVGQQAQIAAKRKAAIEKFDLGDKAFIPVNEEIHKHPIVSWVRGLFGDQTIITIYLSPTMPQRDVDEVAEAFPEAKIIRQKRF